jgi:hypothetical protein
MPVAQTHIGPATPMGARLLPEGITFRFWAPRALRVYVVVNPGAGYQPDPADELVQNPANGHWTAGGVTADGPPMHGLPASAGITIPASGLLVFTR